MPYRLRYSVYVDYVPAGVGLGMNEQDMPGEAWSIGGGGQVFGFYQLVQPTSNTFTNTDVTNLLSAMTTDLTAQMEVSATQTKIQNAATWSAGINPTGA